MTLFTGSCTAMITPFTEDGIDFEAYGRLIDFQIENGTDALLIAGTTGEPPTMTAQEKSDLIRFALDRINKRVPAIVSTGGNNTAAVIEASLAAQAAGADCLLVVTPYYNKATQKGLIAHYNAVADAVDTPIMVYNVPGRTGVNLLPGTFAEIARHKNIVAMKEACGNVAQAQETLRLSRGQADLVLWRGRHHRTLDGHGRQGRGIGGQQHPAPGYSRDVRRRPAGGFHHRRRDAASAKPRHRRSVLRGKPHPRQDRRRSHGLV